jgi:hypothetical protein
MATSSVSFTRPSNTDAYTANDVVGATVAALEFHHIGPAGKDILITTASLKIDVSSVPSGMTSFRLHLYRVTPPSALADNAAWDLPSGDRAAYAGYIDLGTPVDVGATLYVQATHLNRQINLATDSLFGYLVTNGGYTPTSAAVKKVTLHAVTVN